MIKKQEKKCGKVCELFHLIINRTELHCEFVIDRLIDRLGALKKKIGFKELFLEPTSTQRLECFFSVDFHNQLLQRDAGHEDAESLYTD